MAYCTNCGEEIPVGADFCAECGAPAGDESANENESLAQSTGRTTASQRNTGSRGTIGTALNYPKNRDGAIKNPILIGGLLNLLVALPLLGLIPAVLLSGYGMKTFRTTIDGDPQPPIFTDWKNLFIDGLKGFLVIFACLVVPALILIATVSMAAPSQPRVGATGPDLGAFVGAFAISTPFFLIGGYFLPAAFGGVARSGRIGSGFNIARILEATIDGKYFVGWIKAILIYISYFVILLFLFVVSAIPIIGWLLAIPLLLIGIPVLQFYIPIAMLYVFGCSYADSLKLRSRYSSKEEQDSVQPVSDRKGVR